MLAPTRASFAAALALALLSGARATRSGAEASLVRGCKPAGPARIEITSLGFARGEATLQYSVTPTIAAARLATEVGAGSGSALLSHSEARGVDLAAGTTLAGSARVRLATGARAVEVAAVVEFAVADGTTEVQRAVLRLEVPGAAPEPELQAALSGGSTSLEVPAERSGGSRR